MAARRRRQAGTRWTTLPARGNLGVPGSSFQKVVVAVVFEAAVINIPNGPSACEQSESAEAAETED